MIRNQIDMPTWLSKFKSEKEFVDDDETPLWLNPAGWRRIKRFYHGLFYGTQSLEPEFCENVLLASLISGFTFGSMIVTRRIMQGEKIHTLISIMRVKEVI